MKKNSLRLVVSGIFLLGLMSVTLTPAVADGKPGFTFIVSWGKPEGTGLEDDFEMWSNPEIEIISPLTAISMTPGVPNPNLSYSSFVGLQGLRKSVTFHPDIDAPFNSFALSSDPQQPPFVTSNWDINQCQYGPRFEWRLSSRYTASSGLSTDIGSYTVISVNESNRILYVADKQSNAKEILYPGDSYYYSADSEDGLFLYTGDPRDTSPALCASISWTNDQKLKQKLSLH